MHDDWYRLGLQDAVDERPSLALILRIMGEERKRSSYLIGWSVGEQLLTGEGAIYDDSVFPA